MKLIKSKIQLDISPKNPIIKDFLDNIPIIKAKRLLKMWSKLDFYSIKYQSKDTVVDGYIVKPKIIQSDLPCIIYNRGGSKGFGILDEKIVASRLGEYASWGYVVVASQLRGHSGNSYIDEFGGEDLHDILVLKDILKEIKGCNAKNISMIGGSRGGMMTLLSLTKLDDLRSVIIEAAPTDIENSYKLRPQLKEFRRDMYDVDSIDENRKRSAIYFASKISKNTPILILHGRQDKSVDIIDTYKLAIELQINNIPHEIHTFIDADHMLKVPQKWDFKENWLKKYSK